MKLLLYCTKAKPMLRVAREDLFKHQDRARCYKQWEIKYFTKYVSEEMYEANGKIVAECDYEVEKLYIGYGIGWLTKTIIGIENIEKLSCVNREQLYQYCKGKGYAIHIKNLHIFDKPKELSEVYKRVNYRSGDNGLIKLAPLESAPLNMMKVWVDRKNSRILISIRPEWLCKILNGEKTIEVRKKVLKEMLE